MQEEAPPFMPPHTDKGFACLDSSAFVSEIIQEGSEDTELMED